MKKITTLSLCLLMLPLALQAQDTYPRNSQIDILHYIFQLELNDQNDQIEGETTVSIYCKTSLSNLSLDLVQSKNGKGMQVQSVQSAGKALAFTHQNDRLQISAPGTKEGDTLNLKITYQGVPADGLVISKNKYQERTFFGDNWPNRAHHWLPCIDHPYEKATCEFKVIAPNHYQVVANGALREETNLDQNLRLTHWVESVPLPTKVMVIGVANFAVQYLEDYKNIPLQSWVYPQDRSKGFYDYALAREILAYYEENFGPYPYEKLANVQSKTRYGGMENAGNIFYAENSIDGRRGSERLLAHEIVHQWFGDSASEADWYHIWLSEGFATYFTHVYLEARYGSMEMQKGLEKDRQTIIAYYRGQPQSPVVDTTIQDLNALLSPNSYQKGSWVLHMLRMELGDEIFWKGIQTYYQRYQLSNAYSQDFQQVMEEVSNKNLRIFFQQWLYQPGHPQLRVDWSYDEASKQLNLDVQQTQTYLFQFPLEIAIYQSGKLAPEIKQLMVKEQQQSFNLAIPAKPSKLQLDPFVKLLHEAQVTRN